MKRILVLIGLLFLPTTVFALTKTSTPSATPFSKEMQNKIDDLKDRLATKVAELRKTTPRAIYGTVTQVSVSSFTVDSVQKAYKIELTDDIKIAQILKGKRTALDAEDLSKNDVVTIFGNYDETLDILQATHIFIEGKTAVRLHGTISAINKKDNSFTLKGIDESSYEIDIESTTKNSLWSSSKGVEKGGFSKLVTGMYVTVLGTEKTGATDTYTAIRLVTFSLSPALPLTSPTVQGTATNAATP